MPNPEMQLNRALLRQWASYRKDCCQILDYYASVTCDRETLIALLGQQCRRQLRALKQSASEVYELWRRPLK